MVTADFGDMVTADFGDIVRTETCSRPSSSDHRPAACPRFRLATLARDRQRSVPFAVLRVDGRVSRRGLITCSVMFAVLLVTFFCVCVCAVCCVLCAVCSTVSPTVVG
jgi:hypothetical protein